MKHKFVFMVTELVQSDGTFLADCSSKNNGSIVLIAMLYLTRSGMAIRAKPGGPIVPSKNRPMGWKKIS